MSECYQRHVLAPGIHLDVPHTHPAACTCSTDPYNCPQGQALVSAITERKGNQ